MVVDLRRFCHVNPDVLDKCPRNREGSCLGCKKILDIHAKINALSRTLDILLDEEQKLTSTLNDRHDPFTTRLPVEIASTIMNQCLPFSPSLQIFDKHFDKKRHYQALHNLSLVSQNWRGISLAEPGLWTIFPIALGDVFVGESGLNCIQAWLRRSGGAELFVHIRTLGISNSHYERLVSSLIPHAHRWKVLALDMPRHEACLLLSALHGQDLSRLDHLKFILRSNEGDSDTPLNLSASPLIVTANASPLCWPTLDWSRLVQFTMRSRISTQQCLQIFRNAPHLKVCQLRRVTDSLLPLPESMNNFSLESLSQGPGSSTPTFWNTCTFPSLNTLHIWDVSDVSDSSIWPSFLTFLDRTRDSITTFRINDLGSRWPPNSDKAEEIIKHLPKLEHLGLPGTILRSSFIPALKTIATMSNDSHSTESLFKLKSFTLDGPDFFMSSDLSDLLDFAKIMTPRMKRFSTHLLIELHDPRFKGQARKTLVALTKAFYQSVMDLMEEVDLRVTNEDGEQRSLHDLICCEDES